MVFARWLASADRALRVAFGAGPADDLDRAAVDHAQLSSTKACSTILKMPTASRSTSTTSTRGIPPPSGGMDAYLDAIAEYAAAADVLYVNASRIHARTRPARAICSTSARSPAPTSSLNPDDFIPAAWNSVQWDNGVWALPVSVDATMLIYDPAAFDQAGLAYPNERWTIDDLANAARALTQYDANGNVSVPGLVDLWQHRRAVPQPVRAEFLRRQRQSHLHRPGARRPADPVAGHGERGLSSARPSRGGSNQVPMRIMGSFGLRSAAASTNDQNDRSRWRWRCPAAASA